MITQTRIAMRLQRFELIAAAVVVLILAAAAIVTRNNLDAIGVPADCWAAWFGSGPLPVGTCGAAANAFLTMNEEAAGKIMAATALVPFAAGLFLGVPIVAREVEGGTASTVWALAGSRMRWLSGRTLPILVVLVLLLGALAVASEVLWAGRQPWAPLPNFQDAGIHGTVVPAKGLAAFGLSLFVGAALGRTLPAVIVAAALTVGLFVTAGTVQNDWLRAEAFRHAVEFPQTQGGDPYMAAFPGGTYFSDGWRTPEGEVLYSHVAIERAPPGTADPSAWLSQNYTRVLIGVPGSAYPQWSLLETAGFGIVGLVGLVLTFPLVERRRAQ